MTKKKTVITKKGPGRCPYCGDEDSISTIGGRDGDDANECIYTSEDQFGHEEDLIWDRRCGACGEVFYEIYKYAGTTFLKEKK